MTTDEKVRLLIRYINALSNFNIVESGYPYNHMGATITDAMLQAGLKYETVVEPRVEDLRINYPEARTTSGFFKLIEREGVNELLKWKDSEKPNRILEVVRFFVNEEIETENQLRIWLENESNIAGLRKIRGIGNKTLDYFKMLSGISTTAIDRHLFEFLNRAGIQVDSYSEAKEIIDKAAEQVGIKKSDFDYSIWKYMSIGKNKILHSTHILGMAKSSLDLKGAKRQKLELDVLRILYAINKLKEKGDNAVGYVMVYDNIKNTINEWLKKYEFDNQDEFKVLTFRDHELKNFDAIKKEKARNKKGIGGGIKEDSKADYSKTEIESLLLEKILNDNKNLKNVYKEKPNKKEDLPLSVEWDFYYHLEK